MFVRGLSQTLKTASARLTLMDSKYFLFVEKHYEEPSENVAQIQSSVVYVEFFSRY